MSGEPLTARVGAFGVGVSLATKSEAAVSSSGSSTSDGGWDAAVELYGCSYRSAHYLSTFTARAMTRTSVDMATTDCTAMSPLARGVRGMVSLGEKATTLVKLR